MESKTKPFLDFLIINTYKFTPVKSDYFEFRSDLSFSENYENFQIWIETIYQLGLLPFFAELNCFLFKVLDVVDHGPKLNDIPEVDSSIRNMTSWITLQESGRTISSRFLHFSSTKRLHKVLLVECISSPTNQTIQQPTRRYLHG